MAEGLPDYHRPVDIVLQALAEMTVRSKFGAAQLASAAVLATPSTKISLVSISGKGVVYGGLIFVLGESIQSNDVPIFSIDGVEISEENFATLLAYGATVEKSYPIYLLRYDEVRFQYTAGLLPGTTFETGFEILYDEKHGTTPNVFCRALYALV